MMIGNGHTVPDPFVLALEAASSSVVRAPGNSRPTLTPTEIHSKPKSETCTVRRTSWKLETDKLAGDFSANEVYGTSSPDIAGPGAIPDIIDFSHIVCFAISGDGAPFCFDYRESMYRPSVIWWDDAYWRQNCTGYRKVSCVI